MGFGAIDGLQVELPEKVINFGVMEQGATGIAAGMSMAGLRPIVYSIVNFIAYRALEQVRNDVVLQGLNVKFIATGANDYFAMLGQSHCFGDEDVKLMQLIDMKVYDPYSSDKEFDELLDEWITDEQAGYLRV